jgi:hypothetical protein
MPFAYKLPHISGHSGLVPASCWISSAVWLMKLCWCTRNNNADYATLNAEYAVHDAQAGPAPLNPVNHASHFMILSQNTTLGHTLVHDCNPPIPALPRHHYTAMTYYQLISRPKSTQAEC